MKHFYWTEDGHVGRLLKAGGVYRDAVVLRDGQWVATFPAELLWNANPISKAEAVVNLTKWVRDPVTKEEAMRLLDEDSTKARAGVR
jgi:hypothetical protein